MFLKLPICLMAPLFLMTAPAIGAAEQPPIAKAEFEKIIRTYLLEHPEILLDMSQELQKRQYETRRDQSRSALGGKQAELVSDASSPVAGQIKEGDGTVTIVEFFDYRCGYCKKVSPMVQKMVAEDPAIRVVFKEFPILGPESTAAAMAALAANEQGGYLQFHRALMASPDVSMGSIERMAAESGLDVGRLKKDVAKPELQAALERNRTLAQALAIEATPAFVIGHELAPGALDENAFRQLIAKAKADNGTAK